MKTTFITLVIAAILILAPILATAQKQVTIITEAFPSTVEQGGESELSITIWNAGDEDLRNLKINVIPQGNILVSRVYPVNYAPSQTYDVYYLRANDTRRQRLLLRVEEFAKPGIHNLSISVYQLLPGEKHPTIISSYTSSVVVAEPPYRAAARTAAEEKVSTANKAISVAEKTISSAGKVDADVSVAKTKLDEAKSHLKTAKEGIAKYNYEMATESAEIALTLADEASTLASQAKAELLIERADDAYSLADRQVSKAAEAGAETAGAEDRLADARAYLTEAKIAYQEGNYELATVKAQTAESIAEEVRELGKALKEEAEEQAERVRQERNVILGVLVALIAFAGVYIWMGRKPVEEEPRVIVVDEKTRLKGEIEELRSNRKEKQLELELLEERFEKGKITRAEYDSEKDRLKTEITRLEKRIDRRLGRLKEL